MRLRILVVLGCVLATLAVTSGVSWWRESQAGYCERVEAGREELGRFSAEAGPAGILQALPLLEDLAADAPDDIQDEWQTLLHALRALDRAFRDARVDPASYAPATVTGADRERIEAAAADLGSPQVRESSLGIEQHALDVCQTPIGF